MERKRQANFELLRIVAMLMVITLHYLNKGGVMPENGYHTTVQYAAGLIEAFCIVAVNCYVLVSGYFLAEAKWKPRRIGYLLCQILFYSLLVPLVVLPAGLCGEGFTVYDWIGCLFPIQTEHYWFATNYLLLYLLAPFLAAGVRQLDKRSMQVSIVLLLCFYSLGKTILPVRLATDRYGYDLGWFICLFLVAGYLRRFGIPWLEKRKNALVLYVCASMAIWGASAVSDMLSAKINAFSYYRGMPYSYNYLFCLLSSVGLFYVFKDSVIREGRGAKVICALAAYTFGVYLLHEHVLVRYQWPVWLNVDTVKDSFYFIPHMAGSVLLVYAAGTTADCVRAWIFGKVKRLWSH